MRIVADSGSTKTVWKLIKADNSTTEVSTIGLNPYFVDESMILRELKNAFGQDSIEGIEAVFFYGSGCSNDKNIALVREALAKFFLNANIEVHHDMLSAARALFGDKAGIACIIGTGSNTCYYDGNVIVKNVRALGYILGDEGSGAYIGKQFIQDYLNLELPDDVKKLYENKFSYTPEDILDHVYKQDLPNRFLASFAGFIGINKDYPYCSNLLYKAFDDFTCQHLEKYEQSKSLEIGFIGSVAYHNQDILNEVLKDHNMQMGKVLKGPIDELVNYHK